MTSPSPVPRRVRTPRWFDLRLVLGVLLVAASVVIGARVVSTAGATTGMLVAAHDMQPGTVLRGSDLSTRQMRLSTSSGSYFTATGRSTVTGRTLTAPVRAGELIARSAVGATDQAATVTVPVSKDSPDVRRGQRVTLFVGGTNCRGVVVLSDVTVQDVRQPGSGALSTADTIGLVVRVPSSQAGRVLSALELPGATIRVAVLSGPDDARARQSPGDLDQCLSPGGSASPTG